MKVGVIGSGFGLYGLLPAFKSIKGCEVVSICGKKTERLTKYCESIGLKNIYTDWRLMLENQNLDAVAIAVTPSAQYEIAKVAIEKGIHIFAEKPLAANYKQAKELLELSKKNKIITTVDFIFPEIDEWQKVKQLVDKKVYGELKHISVAWDFLSYDIKNKILSWKTIKKEGGGALSFYFSHVLYYLEYYGGLITHIKSNLSYSKSESLGGGETGVDAIITFKNGGSGNVHLSCCARGINTHRLMFICEKATILLESTQGVTDKFSLHIYQDTKSKELILKKSGIKKEGEDERVRIVKKLVSRFIKAVRTGTQITPSFANGERVQQLIEKIRKENIVNNKIKENKV